MSRKPVQARSWPGIGAGKGQQLPGWSGSSGQQRVSGALRRPCSEQGCARLHGGDRARGHCGPRSPRARLLYVETLLLFIFPMYKAKQLIKRHLETAETHSFHVTYFKKR